MPTANEKDANTMDLVLDRLARRAYERRERDERWGTVARYLDMARGAARSMMAKTDVERTQ